MSKIINLLERMGQNAVFRYADADAEQLARLMADTDPAIIEAVLSHDQNALEKMLGARTNVICGIHPADQPDQPEQDEPEEDSEKILLSRAG